MNLSPDQERSHAKGEPITVNVGGQECVLLTRSTYDRFTNQVNFSPWTDEEAELLAAETVDLLADDMFDAVERP